MEFYNYLDDYRIHRNMLRDFRKYSPETYYRIRVWGSQYDAARHSQDDRSRSGYFLALADQLLAERHWVISGRPYVKVYPRMADMLSRIRLDVPMSLLRLPYPVFSLRLANEPGGPGFHDGQGGPEIQALFVFQSLEYPLSDEDLRRVAHAARGGGFPEDPEALPPVHSRPTDPPKFVAIYYQYHDPDSVLPTQTGDGFIHFTWDAGRPISASLERVLASTERAAMGPEHAKTLYVPGPGFMRRIVSLVLASCLLIEGEDTSVLPDLTHKLSSRYEAALKLPPDRREKAMRDIEEKSRKANRLGVTIGRKQEIELPRVPQGRPDGEGTGEGYALRYSHIRSAHPRLQPFGPRDNPTYRVVIVKQARVRPDLPVDPRPRNYRITDRQLPGE